MELVNKIKNKAQNIGFDLVGITIADPFPEAYQILKERKEKGQLPDFMVTEDIKKLTTPRLILPSAKSIISLGMSYASSSHNKNNIISLYARGKDYHKVIYNKLNLLANYIKNLKDNVQVEFFTDTGPLLEREIAQRAGLGWIGKNNNLINENYGSFLFLGEILTNLKLKIDEPAENRCGKCQECLKNCPGGLTKPYFLDKEKCISNITQVKGILPVQDRLRIGHNLWGCDICQQVCPFNKNVPDDLHQEFAPILEGNLEKVLRFSKNNYPSSWNDSALSWRGIRILKRNALIIIGNSKDDKYIPILQNLLTDPSPIIRAYTVWALNKIDIDFNKEKLLNIYKKERDHIVLREIENILGMEGLDV